jgi:hypothetical protein
MPQLRYVVLRHEGYGDPHFDLMIESAPGGDLLTWRSPVWPLNDGIRLTALGNHRRAYLTYDGEVTGGRGAVRRVAEGTCELVQQGSLMLILRVLTPAAEHWLIGPRDGDQYDVHIRISA